MGLIKEQLKIIKNKEVKNPKLLFVLFYVLFITIQVWTQKCAVQKASVDVNISYF